MTKEEKKARRLARVKPVECSEPTLEQIAKATRVIAPVETVDSVAIIGPRIWDRVRTKEGEES